MSPPAAGGSQAPTGNAPPDAAAAAATSPAPIVSFSGASLATNNTFLPDSNIAAGPAHVVTTENSRIQWYDKSGNLQSDTALTGFFGVPVGTLMADTRVVFDSVNNRFVVVSAQINDRVLRVAVSRDSDPNHGWWFAGMPMSETVHWFPYVLLQTGAADITNNYLQFGITAGLGAMLLLILLLVIQLWYASLRQSGLPQK